jgi:Ca2+-binding EF-hand superfamily protein
MGQNMTITIKDFLLNTENEDMVREIFRKYDKDKSNHLDLNEFKSFGRDILKALDQATLDRKKEEKMKNVLIKSHLQPDAKVADHLRILGEVKSFKDFKNFDVNNDGTISYEEFIHYVQKIGSENDSFL